MKENIGKNLSIICQDTSDGRGHARAHVRDDLYQICTKLGSLVALYGSAMHVTFA